MKTFASIIIFSFLLFSAGHFFHEALMSHQGDSHESSTSECIQTCFDVLYPDFSKISLFSDSPIEKIVFQLTLFLLLAFPLFDYYYKIRKKPFVQKAFYGIDDTVLRE